MFFGHCTAPPLINVTNTTRPTIEQPSKHQSINGAVSSKAKVPWLYLLALPIISIQAKTERAWGSESLFKNS